MPKTKRINFTVGRIAEFKAPDSGQSLFWDLSAPGLAVRVTRGSKSYVFQYRGKAGKTTRLTIGSCSVWRLPQAREEARRLQRLVDKGIDPKQERSERQIAKEQERMLVSKAFQAYLSAHRSQWSDRHMSDNLYLSREPKDKSPGGPLWPLLQIRLADVDIHTLIEWAKDVAGTPSESPANQGRLSALRQGYVRFRAFWRWAYQRDEYNGAMSDPRMFAHGDLKALLPVSKPKNDVLEKGQLSTWFDTVTKIHNPVISTYLQILLLTGARRNEIGALKWKDVDFRWKSLWVKDKVEGEEGRKIPLTPYIEYLILALPRRNEWIFSSPSSATGRLVEPRIAHKRALSAAGLPSTLSLHGLRRSFASLAEWVEMPVGIVAQIMGHKPSATAERHYKRRPLDLLAVWHCKLEAWILTEGGVEFNAEAARDGLQVVK